MGSVMYEALREQLIELIRPTLAERALALDWEEALGMNATGDGADAVECPECGSYCRATCDGARGDREADEAYDAMCGGEA